MYVAERAEEFIDIRESLYKHLTDLSFSKIMLVMLVNINDTHLCAVVIVNLYVFMK